MTLMSPYAIAHKFRALAVSALAVAVIAAIPLARTPQATQAGWNPLSPVSVQWSDVPAEQSANGKFLAFNDFHGAIDPPTGSGGLVLGTPAGGSEFLAHWVKQMRADGEAAGRRVLTVGAGDMIGASPLVSAAFHDEPAIEEVSALGLQISSVGNHEFDEGVPELRRMQNGGCHPTDGCQDGDGFAGADFTYLAANVIDKRTGFPIMPPVSVKIIDGVPVGFIGMTLEGTGTIINPGAPGISNIEFRDEVETTKIWSKLLRLFGIKAQVLLVHEGGTQDLTGTPSTCAGFAGAIKDIVAGLPNEVGLVVSGHTHRFYSCSLPNAAGVPVAVTSAGANGTLVTDIDFTLDKHTRTFASITAHNQIVENGISDGHGGWQKDANGNFLRNPALVDPAAKAIADKYRTAVAPLANKVIGKITTDITRSLNPAQESALGDVIADGMIKWASAATPQIAIMNPGGIRADLSYAFSPGGEPPGDVTYGECFTVQPFNNLVTTLDYTGAQLKDVLEQQFVGFGGQGVQRVLQISAGFTYSWDSTQAPGGKISNMALNGVPIDPAATYRVTMNDFLANGGDGFTNLKVGTNRVTAPGFDVDALVAYLGTGPIAPGPQNRITKIA
jgi:5'-nucleotidase